MTGKIEKWILENQIIEAEPCTYNATEILPWARERDAEIEALTRRNAELTTLGNDVAAALSAAMDSGEPIDPEGIDHCNYVIGRWVGALTPTESEDVR